MSVNWTEEQKQAIEATGGNILVSAAAGSGKTAVLVERIIRKITNPENPVSVDSLLVLTFTEAAAAGMKRKIAEAIEKKIDENPDDENLKEQSIRLGMACISTIHSFCSRIISNNAHLTDLPADIRLVEDSENDVLIDKAINDALEVYYSRIDKKLGFYELVSGWGGVKKDDDLRKIIKGIYKDVTSFPYPKLWIREAKCDYYECIKKGKSVWESKWANVCNRVLTHYCDDIESACENINKIAEDAFSKDDKSGLYFKDIAFDFLSRYAEVKAENDVQKLAEFIKDYTVRGMTGIKKDCSNPYAKEKLCEIRDSYVKGILKEAKLIAKIGDSDTKAGIVKLEPVVRTLLNIVRLTEKLHIKYKRDRSVIDFSDLEHEALKLICSKKDKETELCGKIRERYSEIFIDEFQDTNQLQWEIFSHISKPDGNLFMVGDVKQAIYEFRNADPTIFLNLAEKYEKKDGGQLIRLSKNFRSRDGVVDCVNHIFSGVMTDKTGKINYAKGESLVRGAEYLDSQNTDTEIMITNLTDKDEKERLKEDLDTNNVEARAVAIRIKRLVCDEKFMVYDDESKNMRPIRYGDIAVLSTTNSAVNEVEDELEQLNISYISESGQSYLSTYEVSTVLSFLQIIDNPLQDVPLIAVMLSKMFNFTPDELAKIRACKKKKCRYYNALCEAAKRDEKAKNFVDELDYLRKCAQYMGVDELVLTICRRYNFFAIAGAMTNGNKRRENLKLLIKRCTSFEQGVLSGLFDFLNYIKIVNENDKGLTPATGTASKKDSVIVTTYHRSKGLEFPVVILYKTGSSKGGRNSSDIICNTKATVGIDLVDTRQRVRCLMPTKALVEVDKKFSEKEEEMRLLYVGMTRAKEKLIISASVTDRDNGWKYATYDQDGRILDFFIKNGKFYRDWIFYSVLNHEDGGYLRNLGGITDIVPRLDFKCRYNIYEAEFDTISDDEEYDADAPKKSEALEVADELIKEKLEYEYPYRGMSQLPVKVSVSEVKRRLMQENDGAQAFFKKASYGLLEVPEDLNAAEMGTIMHFVMQHIDASETDSVDAVKTAVDKMVKNEMMTQKQASAVNFKSIYGFYSSELGKRLKAAEKDGKAEKEYDFYMLIKPNEIFAEKSAKDEDDIIIQGIADCFFYEDDGIVLVDYKTDSVFSQTDTEERAESYRLQIEYYAKGIEEITGVSVKEKYLYFLKSGITVSM